MPTTIRYMATHAAESPTTLEGEIVQPLRRLLQACVEFVGADKGCLQLYDEHRVSFEMIAQVGFDQQFHDRFRFLRASSSVAVSDLQSGQQAVNGSVGVMLMSGDTTLKAKGQISDD